MFEKLEKLFTDLVDIVKKRVGKLEDGFAGVEDDLGTLKADLAAARGETADLKAEIADMKRAAADLSGFQAAVDGLKGEPASKVPVTDPAPQPEAPAPVVDTEAGTTTHTAADGTVTTLDHEAGIVTATDGEGAPAAPVPAAVDAVVQATVDDGVAVPEALTSAVDVQAPVPEPVI